jgi:outer membrane protein TolC
VRESELYNQRSVDNYKNGLSPFINVADAQMTYLENMNSLIVAQGNALTALINYYKAIPN